MIGIERTAAAGMVSGRPCIRNLRWYIILLFFFATIISYVDRQALSVNAPHLRRDLGLSATQYSYLVTAFLVAYTMGPVLAGRLIDSIGIRLGMTCAIVWWSVAASLHAFGSSLAALLALRFCLGLGEAATISSTSAGCCGAACDSVVSCWSSVGRARPFGHGRWCCSVTSAARWSGTRAYCSTSPMR